ncbi:hypothetical protein ACFRFJ_01610 [Streptomyces hydrogenans]|uniref:hypothetical protein n=1 Tax=Streptomyces hydrogenans TaxID=1873719 RepID=UPI003694015B
MPLSLAGGACAVLARRRRAVRRGAVTGHGAGTGRLRVADVREHGHAPLTRRHPVGRVVDAAMVGATGAGFDTSPASASGTGTGTSLASGICASPGPGPGTATGFGTATGSDSGSGSGLGHGTGLDFGTGFDSGPGLGHGTDFDFGPGHSAGFNFGTSTSTPTGSGTGGSHRPGRRIRRGPGRSPTGRTVHTSHTHRTVRTGHTVGTSHTSHTGHMVRTSHTSCTGHTVRISGRRGIRRTRRQVDRCRRARGRRPLLVTLHEVRVRPVRAARQAWRPVAEGVGCQGAEARARGSEEPVHEVGHPEVTSR